MTKGRIVFSGSSLEFWAVSWIIAILTVLTLGILWPWLALWQLRYVLEHSEIVITTETSS